MKLFTAGQIAAIDRYTIDNEPVTAIDLMERAAGAVAAFLESRLLRGEEVVFFAGPGNNGGDALAVARMLAGRGTPCRVYIADTGRPLSGSAEINRRRLQEQGLALPVRVASEADFPALGAGQRVVDGLFGSGLTRPLEGLAAALVRHINTAGCRVCAIDLPSGLMGEDNSGTPPDAVIRAAVTVTLQFPKLSLLFPENERYAGVVETLSIGLHPAAIAATPTPYHLLERCHLEGWFPPRALHSHKGSYGHALLVAGSCGKMGAAVLASKGCLRAGAGLLTAVVPDCGYEVLQGTVPEAMCHCGEGIDHLSALPPLATFSAAGAGPGLGTHPETAAVVRELAGAGVPLVLDADALNILSADTQWAERLPAGTILTPHPGEFRRLAGDHAGSWQRLTRQRELSQQHRLVIVLKGARTVITLPDGRVFFNPTGNPGMATAGSGDLLTGIILGLLAQGLEPSRAARAGVFLHGLAGDKAAARLSEPALLASDIGESLGEAFREIYHGKKQDF